MDTTPTQMRFMPGHAADRAGASASQRTAQALLASGPPTVPAVRGDDQWRDVTEGADIAPAQRKILLAERLALRARELRLEAVEEARAEGRSYAEIGRWLGISKQSVRRIWLMRARNGSTGRGHPAAG